MRRISALQPIIRTVQPSFGTPPMRIGMPLSRAATTPANMIATQRYIPNTLSAYMLAVNAAAAVAKLAATPPKR